MNDFKDKVAVITGAASGIGLSLAHRAAREGMKVVLADVEEAALAQAERVLVAGGANALAVPTDVSKERDVEALARKTLAAFGPVHLLCNNAGVAVGTTVWEDSLADWEWVIAVNLWGVIHGIRVFVPVMLEQETACHIVNTASTAGLVSPPGQGIYNVTKHGVVALTETLYQELALRGAKLRVSVLCPAFVRTRIFDAERNRPAGSRPDPAAHALGPEELEAEWAAIEGTYSKLNTKLISPDEVADRTFAGIRDDQLYILTHPESKEWVRKRMEDIIAERNPEILDL